MGTGKTTVGRLLARELRLEFVDTDREIEAEHGPIPEIFAGQGEAAFRQMEAELAVRLAERDGVVISTGGRMLLDATNADVLGAAGRIFCLTAEPTELVRRLTGPEATDRPLLAGAEPRTRITELLDERRAGYARFEQVPTDGHTPEAIVNDLLSRLRLPG